jgi:2'-5' RNA ligase
VIEVMQRVASGDGALDLSLQGLGVFPGLRNPRVLWTGVGGRTDLLMALQRRLDDNLVAAGFPGEGRPFKAHLTIARIKEPVEARRMAQAMEMCGRFDPLALQAAEMVLIKSDLRPNGPVYTPLARAALS